MKGTELLGFRMRAGGAICSQMEVQAETTIPMFSPPPFQPEDAGTIILDNIGYTTYEILQDSVSPNLWAHSSYFQ